jgi:hypothetical protein
VLAQQPLGVPLTLHPGELAIIGTEGLDPDSYQVTLVANEVVTGQKATWGLIKTLYGD